eukprot:gene8798-11880_t
MGGGSSLFGRGSSNISPTPVVTATAIADISVNAIHSENERISSQELIEDISSSPSNSQAELPYVVPANVITPVTTNSVTIAQLTPRSTTEHEIRTLIFHTPMDEPSKLFPYYCPLCMMYYKSIWKSNCCENYICSRCCKDYLSSKGILDFIERQDSELLERIPCPHCMTSGFQPKPVTFDEEIRDYDPCDYVQNSIPYHGTFSPLRVGDSFEALKRKMIPFRSSTSDHIQSNFNNSMGIAITTDESEDGRTNLSPYNSNTSSPRLNRELIHSTIRNNERLHRENSYHEDQLTALTNDELDDALNEDVRINHNIDHDPLEESTLTNSGIPVMIRNEGDFAVIAVRDIMEVVMRNRLVTSE